MGGRPNSDIKIKPRTPNQKTYLDIIDRNFISLAVGPAGTGKTFLAILKAMKAYENLECSKIVLTRPAKESGERLGFLPGNLNEKMDPWLQPLFDAMHEFWQPERIDEMIDKGEIEIAPVAYLRGRTFRDSYIIADEAQNLTKSQFKMLVTRFGENSKMIVCGDKTQSDFDRPWEKIEKKTLDEMIRIIDHGVEGMDYVEFGVQDVVRHYVVKNFLDSWRDLGIVDND